MSKKQQKNNAITVIQDDFIMRFWSGADHRKSIVKELRRRIETLKADVNSDSTQKNTLCERVVFVTAQLETMERRCIESGFFDSGTYIALSNCLTGMLRLLGLERRAKPVQNLKDYIKSKEKTAG